MYVYNHIKLYRYQIFPYLITYTFDYGIFIFFLGGKKKRKKKTDVYTCDFRIYNSNDSTFCQMRIEIYNKVSRL